MQVEIAKVGGIPAILAVMDSDDEEIKAAATWAIFYLAGNDANKVFGNLGCVTSPATFYLAKIPMRFKTGDWLTSLNLCIRWS